MIQSISRVYDKCGCVSKKLIDEECTFTYEAAAFIFGGAQGIADAIGSPDAFKRTHSVGHISLARALDNLIGVGAYREEYTFDWLVNPETGRHLYYDFYIPS